jgi:hypothetical protein
MWAVAVIAATLALERFAFRLARDVEQWALFNVITIPAVVCLTRLHRSSQPDSPMPG